MAERAMVFETSNLGVESLSTPGTAVQTTKTLASLSATVQPDPEVKTYTPKGNKFATAAVLIKETTKIKLDGLGTYNETVYPLATILTDPVITTPGGATLSRDWTFSMKDAAPDSQRTYSCEFGTNAIRAAHCQNAIGTEFGLTFNRKDVVKAGGALLALPIQDDKVRWLKLSGSPTGGTFTITVGAFTTPGIAYNATASAVQTALAALSNVGAGNVLCTGGPMLVAPIRILFTGALASASIPAISTTTDSFTGGTLPATGITRLSPGTSQLSLVPISPTEISIATALSQAGLGAASPLARDFAAVWKLGNRSGVFFPMNAANGAGFGGTVETTPKGEFSFDVAADDVGMGYLANVRKGDTVFVRVSATGPLIETGFNHSMQIDTAVKLSKVSEFKDIDGSLLGLSYSGEWAHDPTWGFASVVTMRNSLTAL